MKQKMIFPVSTFAGFVLILSVLTGCCTCPLDLEDIDYTPLVREDWEVSTPEAQGLDPMLVAEMYCRAAYIDTIFSLLVIKDGIFSRHTVH